MEVLSQLSSEEREKQEIKERVMGQLATHSLENVAGKIIGGEIHAIIQLKHSMSTFDKSAVS